MKKYSLLMTFNVDGKDIEIPILNSDLMSIEVYTSYCDDFNSLLTTILYTNPIVDNDVKKPNAGYHELYNFIKDHMKPNSLKLDVNVPIFYSNDSDVVFCTPNDILRLTDNGKFSGALVLRELKKLDIKSNGWKRESFIKSLEECYLDKQRWFLFIVSLKKIVKEKFKITDTENPNDTLEKRRTYFKCIENNHDLVSQIYNSLEPYFPKKQIPVEQKCTFPAEELDDNYILELLIKESQSPICKGKEKKVLLTMISLYEQKQKITDEIDNISLSKKSGCTKPDDQLKIEKLNILLADAEYKLELLNSGEYHFTDNDEIEFDYAKEYNEN